MKLVDWENISINLNSTIREALTVLDKQAIQIVLVVSSEKKLIGTLTDGDVRRGLLKGKTLENSIESIVNTSPTIGKNNETELVWRQRIKRKSLRHLPIVSSENQIIGLYFHKSKQTTLIKNPVVLMLGGQGMRLRPLTETLPKPMLPIGNKPILETIVKHIAEQGFTEFYFCINYLGEKIKNYFGDGHEWGVNITYIEETKVMGTAGALSLLPKLPDLPLIVMNGDLLTKVDFRAFLNLHIEHKNSITACIREYSYQVPYGVVEMDGQEIKKLVEKPVQYYFVNAGIYCLNQSILESVPSNTIYDMPTLITDLKDKNNKLGGFPLTEYWKDIGHIPDYEQAQVDFEIYFS